MMYLKLFHEVTDTQSGTPVKVTFDDAQPGIIALFFFKKKKIGPRKEAKGRPK